MLPGSFLRMLFIQSRFEPFLRKILQFLVFKISTTHLTILLNCCSVLLFFTLLIFFWYPTENISLCIWSIMYYKLLPRQGTCEAILRYSNDLNLVNCQGSFISINTFFLIIKYCKLWAKVSCNRILNLWSFS